MTEILLHTPELSAAPSNGASTPVAAPPLATPSATPSPLPGVAEFEKASVARTVTKLAAGCTVEDLGQTVSLDDRIRVVGEFQVVKVTHEIDKDGAVVRVQTVKPAGDIVLVPWNPSDPTDNGIVRARP